MDKKIDSACLNQYADDAIKRGYEIYDEWIGKNQSSRKIVASAYGAAKLFKTRKAMSALVEALAYLFALDARIKEKYNSILRCLFSYFSWRRETRALDALKRELDIPIGETDIRNLIAVEIKRLVEKLEDEWKEDGDDETHGGKRNGKNEEEVASEEKEGEAEELSDKEETKKTSEEKEEDPLDNVQNEEEKEKTGEKKEDAELQHEKDEVTSKDKQEELVLRKSENPKEEKNVSVVEPETKADKKEEAGVYNDTVDYLSSYDEANRDSSSEKKTSFIDEMIIDDMVKGDKSIIGYRHIDEEERQRDAYTPKDTVTGRNEERESTDKDAYLYDEMLAADKGEAQPQVNTEATKQAEKVADIKTEQPNNTVDAPKQEPKPISDVLQTDNISVDQENYIARELNENMSDESKLAYVRMQEEQLREHVKITLEELGINDTVEIVRVSEPDTVKSPSVMQGKK